MMWQGIIVNGSGKIYMTSSTIEDALTALTINGTGGWEIGGTSIANSHFNKNERDIVINGTSQYTNFIKSTVFDHTIPLGIGGYGIDGIIINAQTSATPIIIGGNSNPADICQFLGGQYSVRSTDANVDIKRCLFSEISTVAVDFQGNNTSGTLRKLNFISSSVVNSKRCILSQHKTDLTVQYSSFSGATEHAIEWDDNHDGHLLIGDLTDPLKGNTFQSNAWIAIVAWDNKTAQTALTTLASNTANLYTSIVIANNTIAALPYTGGILIGEWALGSEVPYHKLEVAENSVTGTLKGIQLFNVRGYGGAFTTPPTAFTVPTTAVNENQIGINTSISATAFGINAENAPGFSFVFNLIGSDNPLNWQNSGIRILNSQYSTVATNAIETGTGISIGLDMQYSGIYCNILQNNVSGITLCWAALCPDVSHPHGSYLKAHDNSFVMDQPATIHIHDYYSPVNNNNWVWDNTATATFPLVYYSGITPAANETNGSIILQFDGAYDCPYQQMMYAIGPNIDATMADAESQWRADYYYEIRRLLTDSGSSTVASANIKSIIGIENNIGAGYYADALTAVMALTPTNDIEENYKDVLTIFANINYPTKREPTTTEFSDLTAIAEQFPRTGGSAVTLARTYLAVKYNLYFKDEMFTDGVAYGTATISSPCSMSPASGTEIGFMDAEGNDLQLDGTIIQADGSFAFDPYQLKYFISTNPYTEYRIYSKYGSTYTVQNAGFLTLENWISASPIALDLAGVSLILDTITDSHYQTIPTVTSIPNGEDDYSIGIYNDGTSNNFLLEKYSGESLIWSATFDGPAHREDTATCMTMDSEGNIYVAGKVDNGLSYDYQILKYDNNGVLIWTAYIADSLKRENTPTGISVDEKNVIRVTGTCATDTSLVYMYVSYDQCLPPIGDRLANAFLPADLQQSTIELYPNPSDGKITIVMKDQSEGLLELFNLAGQPVFSQHITRSGEVLIPAEKVANGVYLLKFTGTSNPQFKKLVIQRN
jgi:hypothetical protein